MRNGLYLLVIAPSEYPGKLYRNRYVYEHHCVWWRNTGDVVPDGFLIHHKDGDKHNNRFENLEIVSRSDHSRMHKPGFGNVTLVCEVCGKSFDRRISIYRKGHVSLNTQICCSRSCVGKLDACHVRKNNQG